MQGPDDLAVLVDEFYRHAGGGHPDPGMAGIGSPLGAAPVIRNNRCYRNVMAGIGSREGAWPVIEDNECFENKMAGIGSQQDAAPVIRNNRCYKNEMAGIALELRSGRMV